VSRLIVTGGAGFIGCNLARALNLRGHTDLTIVDRIDHIGKKRNLDRIQCREFVDKDVFRECVRGDTLEPVDAIFHLGACSSTTEMNEAFLDNNNTAYTRELCEWSLRHGARFIYASSAATYGDGSKGYSDDHALIPTLQPMNPYGWSKQKFDLWALQNNLLDRIVGLKYFNVYGPYEDHKGDMRSMINKAYDQIRSKGELTLFKSHRPDYRDGEQERDFIYVKDAIAMTLFFFDHPLVNGIFNCGTGLARTWVDLARAVFAAMDRTPQIRFVDIPDTIRDRYQYHTRADMTKLRASGFRPATASIEDGVREYVVKYLASPGYCQ
jgi:ADP-L-glycero-D-manno-heptose 6-epimerase